MARYQHKDISLEPPTGWLESTVARFHPPPSPVGSPPVPSITMEVEPLRAGATLRMHADQLLVKLSKTVQGFDLLNGEETMIGDRPAVLFRFQFTPSHVAPEPNEEAPERMEQTMAVVAAGSEREPQVAVLAIACPSAAAASSMAVFTNVLRSVRFDDPGHAAASATASPPTRPSAPAPAEYSLGPMPGVRGR